MYPITKEKDAIFETSMHYHLDRLTEYYDLETRKFKKQSKIIFIMKIISPKLDEIAKDKLVESGKKSLAKSEIFLLHIHLFFQD